MMAQWIKVISMQAWPAELIPRTHVNMVKEEGENPFLKVVLWTPHMP